jgi:hypothetical protein
MDPKYYADSEDFKMKNVEEYSKIYQEFNLKRNNALLEYHKKLVFIEEEERKAILNINKRSKGFTLFRFFQ